jgi:ATP-dependent HslUV protease ATP-binding subunit HslU
MVFYMPGRVEAVEDETTELTPRQIVVQLDRFIVGQGKAKRAVAIALRNRVRRRKLPPEMADEVMPKNILMIGPTGVGKTEIARRLARLSGSPFVKVEASKFTEVGYVGRDVESMVRDLVEIGIEMARQERRRQVRAREREEQASWERSRETLGRRLEAGELEDRVVEIESTTSPMAGMRIFGAGGMEELDMNLKEMLPGLFQGKPRQRKMTVGEAREALQREEEDKLVDPEQLSREAIRRVEQSGIIFVDEMDKIAGREGGHGPDVSREGVQRDLLPIVEGTLVHTKHGMVRTDHILFVAAGAFHVSKPSDMIPELQGRFPIRVELDSLGRDELLRILTEPESSLVRQYHALMQTEGVELVFTDDGVAAIAEAAATVNSRTENIGARRLSTIMERLLDEVSFEGSEIAGQRVVIDEAYVRARLDDIAQDTDLSRFIL